MFCNISIAMDGSDSRDLYGPMPAKMIHLHEN